jgi:IclR family pca regulon transcriptional regulator
MPAKPLIDGVNRVPLEVGSAASTDRKGGLEGAPGDPDFMTSLARGLSVIQSFTRESSRMTISQVSGKTDLSRAAVRRCLHTLKKLGFVDVEDERYFSLSPRVLALSHAYTSSGRLPSAAQPVLERLSALVHESCSVATLDGDELLYVARAHVSRIMTVDLAIGSRLPAYCTSMGRVLLGHLPAQALEEYLSRVTLRRHTSRTVVSVLMLRKLLGEVRNNGYALVDQELEEGLRSLAVPVRNADDEVVAAMNVGAQAQRMPLEELQSRFLWPLMGAAKELTLALR